MRKPLWERLRAFASSLGLDSGSVIHEAANVADTATDLMQWLNKSPSECPVCGGEEDHDPGMPCGALWDALGYPSEPTPQATALRIASDLVREMSGPCDMEPGGEVHRLHTELMNALLALDGESER